MNDEDSLSASLHYKTPIILLKTRSQPDDSYEELFSNPDSEYIPTFVPVLHHEPNPTGVEQLRYMLENADFAGDNPRYGGLIFTSQRAVEAFATIVQELEANPDKRLNFPPDTPLYTVGPATSRSLHSLVSRSTALAKATVLGADTGNGEKLAYYMLDHYNVLYSNMTRSKPPLLFLVGEQRRDIIPKILMAPDLPKERRTQVDELVVYQTGITNTFCENFSNILDAIKLSPVACVVIFSPAGCEKVLQCLGYVDKNADPTSKVAQRWTKTEEHQFCVATIGPTTRDHLRDRFGFEPDVCAARPSPTGVMNGVTNFLKAKRFIKNKIEESE